MSLTGSAVDALVVALAEPGGTVLTGDQAGIEALAAHARLVSVALICKGAHRVGRIVTLDECRAGDMGARCLSGTRRSSSTALRPA